MSDIQFLVAQVSQHEGRQLYHPTPPITPNYACNEDTTPQRLLAEYRKMHDAFYHLSAVYHTRYGQELYFEVRHAEHVMPWTIDRIRAEAFERGYQAGKLTRNPT